MDGQLLVCDTQRGLVRVDPRDGAVRVLAGGAGGEPLRFCSNVALGADGALYFSVSCRRYALEDWMGDILEHTGTGQLLRRRPGGEPEVLLDGLHLANSVALAEDESFVIVAESSAYRIRRLWLSGPRSGRCDTSRVPRQHFARARGRVLGRSGRAPGTRRRLAAPNVSHVQESGVAQGEAVHPRPRRTVRVMALRPDGGLPCDLSRAKSPYRMVTSVCRSGSCLIMGSLIESGCAVCELPVSPSAFAG
ncbi:SMP-30/gluconolactonase/LRE family protein [Streptomyces sp. NPDC048434]|uniref:SMP-30/gluconolactonase/LRE family protein n=1 Tax=Streptomyces sp. NPDC048434 TaxID=3365549 RepID=UPI00371E2529